MSERYTRRFWTSLLLQLAPLIFLTLGVVKSAVSGRYLLIAASLWFIAALAWDRLGPHSFFLNLGSRNRKKAALAFAFGWFFPVFYPLFLVGWLAPLAIGIYRVALRR